MNNKMLYYVITTIRCSREGLKIIALKKLRQQAGITQYGLSQKLHVSQQAIASWESGSRMPRADKLPEIAEALGCTVNDLYDKTNVEKKGA